MVPEATQYLLNLTDNYSGIDKEEMKQGLINTILSLGGGSMDDDYFENVFLDAMASGQMSEWRDKWYSNERFVYKEAFTRMIR